MPDIAGPDRSSTRRPAARLAGLTVTVAVAVTLVAGSLAACRGGGDGDTRSGSGRADAPTTIDDRGGTTVDDDVARVADAYVAGQPLVITIRTLQRFAGLIGVNTLFWQNTLSGPANRIVVAPNRDTLYSIAVLDLRSGPMALTLPAIGDRYYTYQYLDAWTESFAYVGTRATGGAAGTWVVTPPGWEGDVPEGVHVLESDTPLVFLLGRFLVDDAADVAGVQAISRDVRLEPLAALTGGPVPADPPPLGDPAGPPQDLPTDATYFDELGDALALAAPPTPGQRHIVDAVAGLGIGPGRHPVGDGADAARRALLDEGAAAGDARIDDALATGADTSGGWSRPRAVGTYGDDVLRRAVVARIGWGANVPEESVYAVARTDADGEPLDGSSTYRITFPPGGLPPVDGFWSLTVYGEDMYLVEDPSDRYAVGDRTPGLVPAPDGSLTVDLVPGGDPSTDPHVLPVPDGPFVLMLRLYLPGGPVLDGSYDHPPVERVGPAG